MAASRKTLLNVVIPSLPGYGFFRQAHRARVDPARIARAWIGLMKRLGYTRYVAQGGDLGKLRNGADGSSGALRDCLAISTTWRLLFQPTVDKAAFAGGSGSG